MEMPYRLGKAALDRTALRSKVSFFCFGIATAEAEAKITIQYGSTRLRFFHDRPLQAGLIAFIFPGTNTGFTPPI
jgi:hypothetical protein